MNFLILGIFWNFYKSFNSIYFELNSLKIFILSPTDVVDDVAFTKKRCHVVTYETAKCHTCVHVRAYVSARVRACTHMCVCVCD